MNSVFRHLLRDLMKPWAYVLGVCYLICCRRIGYDFKSFKIWRRDLLSPIQCTNVKAWIFWNLSCHKIVEFTFGIVAKEYVVMGKPWAIKVSRKTQYSG